MPLILLILFVVAAVFFVRSKGKSKPIDSDSIDINVIMETAESSLRAKGYEVNRLITLADYSCQMLQTHEGPLNYLDEKADVKRNCFIAFDKNEILGIVTDNKGKVLLHMARPLHFFQIGIMFTASGEQKYHDAGTESTVMNLHRDDFEVRYINFCLNGPGDPMYNYVNIAAPEHIGSPAIDKFMEQFRFNDIMQSLYKENSFASGVCYIVQADGKHKRADDYDRNEAVQLSLLKGVIRAMATLEFEDIEENISVKEN